MSVSFQARVVPDHESAWPFSVTVIPGGVVVRGQVSAGRSGWLLSATVLRRRVKLMLQVSARPRNVETVPDIEQHEYEAVLNGVTGQYDVYVTHTFYSEGAHAAFPEPRYLGRVVVGAPALLALLLLGDQLMLLLA